MDYDKWKMETPPEEPEMVTCYLCHTERSPANVDWQRIGGNDVTLCRSCYNEYQLKPTNG